MWYLNTHLKSVRKFFTFRNSALKFSNITIRNEKKALSFQIGEQIAGYQLQKIDFINELQCEAILLQHIKTKSEHFHINRKSDRNNAFSVQFRTTPENDTGVAHILEHLVLCGSLNYPVRDPFFKMLNRSLSTFMNAMTSPDSTMYPFSTQNEADYRNLMKIYTDAVFHPNLDPKNFQIEGWRLEHDQVHDPKSPIIFKGIVFNEMKGSFSEKDNLLFQKVLNYLLPNHAYKYMYGGHPMEIPNLSYDQLKQFHTIFYHPSNAKFYTYGSFPLEDTLHFLNSEYLSKYESVNCQHTQVPLQEIWNEKQRRTIEIPIDNLMKSKPYSMAIAYKTNDICDLYDNYTLEFLAELLTSGLNAPLYKSLIEPGKCSGFTPSTGYLAYCRNGIFLVGLQGLENIGAIEESIRNFDETLREILNCGFEEHHIQATRHKFQLDMQHERTNKGLELIQNVSSLWNHGADPIKSLRRREMFSELFEAIENNPKLLQDKLSELIVDNNHRLELLLVPDQLYEQKLKDTETQLLNAKLSELNVTEKCAIFENGISLEKHLNEAQDHSSILPCLRLEDIDDDIEETKIIEFDSKNNLSYCLAPTNELIYFNSLINVKNLTIEQQLLLPVFAHFITKLATEKFGFKELDSLISRTSSGFNLCPHAVISKDNFNDFRAELMLSSYSLGRNFLEMMNIWVDLLKPRHLDAPKGHLENLMQLYVADLSNGLMYSGHKYAMLSASSLVSKSDLFNENMSGLRHVYFTQDLFKKSLNDTGFLLTQFEEILNNLANQRTLFTLSTENNLKLIEKVPNFVKCFETPTCNEFKSDNVLQKDNTITCIHHVLSNSPVYYCSKAIATVPFTHNDYAPLTVLCKYLTTRYLHPVLREKQGAYGGGITLSDGVLRFYSYRDPENRKTLDTFDRCYSWFQEQVKENRDISEQELLEAKLGVFQKIDAPITPGNRGLNHFVYGLSYDLLKKFRLAILNVKCSDLHRVLETYLSNVKPEVMSKVILGPQISDQFVSNENWNILEQK